VQLEDEIQYSVFREQPIQCVYNDWVDTTILPFASFGITVNSIRLLTNKREDKKYNIGVGRKWNM
jgi:hypothetical protein